MHGKAEASKLVGECDVLLAVGVRFSDRSTRELQRVSHRTPR